MPRPSLSRSGLFRSRLPRSGLSAAVLLFPTTLLLTGCGVVVATVDTAASVAGSAVSVAGDVVSATAHVATAPFRGGDDKKDE
ncbi:hypothetical protein D9623_32125 [Azospirillum brasilense]|uniref:Uncharacterized protein n=1 Tax=Azospirillum brasilense TaxID=192 RepID=A0A0P0FGX7_AZOBR|nr:MULTISPECIES: hypothetical protein [Azospirillum]ALJ39046.1 hypothetical protein AMK58_26550 [Azospirillum brasilense]MDW7557944.1 hypothetical protein [Azospirillum brasilense]MDW7596240.1 hypothetical protein [Azospirillum brasilense]MDW7628390.1 hypothetical protein [Azospirillum brasilense]MDX5950537.1 hypothetical protein [Azospirillum brasilense]